MASARGGAWQAGPGRLRGAQPLDRALFGCRGRTPREALLSPPGAAHPCRAAATRSRLSVASGTARPRRRAAVSALAAVTATRSISSRLSRRRARRPLAEYAFSLERTLLLAYEPRHPHDDQPEEQDRRERGWRRSRDRRRGGRGRSRSAARTSDAHVNSPSRNRVSAASRPGSGCSSRAIDGCRAAAPQSR